MNNRLGLREDVVAVLTPRKPRLYLPPSRLQITGHVCAVLTNIHSGEQQIHETTNLICSAGAVWYAQSACGDTLTTDTFSRIVLGTAMTPAPEASSDLSEITQLGSSIKTVETGFPKTDDATSGNTGGGEEYIVTWHGAWDAAECDAGTVTHVAICQDSGEGNALLCAAAFSPSFALTDDDTLKVFINHTFADNT